MATAAEFEVAKATHDRLDAEVARTSAAMQRFPKNGPMGLTPDHIKSSPEFQTAKGEFDRAFASFRTFNVGFNRRFARQLREERRAKRAARFSATSEQQPC